MSPPSRIERRKADLRARVLEVAAERFMRDGVEATKVDDICEDVDVAKRTFYNHFSSKAAIVQALGQQQVAQVIAIVHEARRAGNSTRERVALLFSSLREAWPADVRPNRELMAAFFRDAHESHSGGQHGVRLSDAIYQLVMEGGAKQLPDSFSPQTFADIILGLLYSISIESSHHEQYDTDEHVQNASKSLDALLASVDFK